MRVVPMAGALLAVLVSLPLPARGQEPNLLVDNDQVVTLTGSSPSLHGVVQQLCAAANVELLQYDAEDRPWAGNYQDMPLADLLPRLLRAESNAVGLRAAAGSGKPRIAWLRVMGKGAGDGSHRGGPVAVRTWTPESAARAQAQAPPVPGEPPVVPITAETVDGLPPDQAATIISAVLNPAFTASDDDSRTQALESIASNLNSNADAKTTLLKADPKAVARALAVYPDVRSIFAMLQSSVHDPEMQRRFNAIGAELNGAIAANLGR